MSLTVVLIGAFIVGGIGLWLYFGGESGANESGAVGDIGTPSEFRCKVCGANFEKFLAAHEHASADHELAGHKIDEAIETV
jgi:hypothetical protein